MVNFNLDLKNASELINSPIGYVSIGFASILLSFLLGTSFGSSTKDQVCPEEMELIPIQSQQIAELELDLAEAIGKGETSCIQREQKICRKEKEQIKTNCNKLIENLCGQGVSLE